VTLIVRKPVSWQSCNVLLLFTRWWPVSIRPSYSI